MVADCLAGARALIVGGLPARLSSEKLAASLVPVVVAVAVNRPAVVLAPKRGEVARPEASVVSVAWLEPPTKLAPALAEPPAPAPAPVAGAERERHRRPLQRLAAPGEHLHLQRLAIARADGRRLFGRRTCVDRRWLAGEADEAETGRRNNPGRGGGRSEPAGGAVGGEQGRGGRAGGVGRLSRLACAALEARPRRARACTGTRAATAARRG